jgi:hypothetical protein
MSDYLTLAEALAIHDDQIERLGYELVTSSSATGASRQASSKWKRAAKYA